MATVKRRRRLSQRELGPYKRHELLTGEIDYPMQGYTGYGDGTGTDLAAFIGDEMPRLENAPRELLKFWASGEYTTGEIFPDSKPWLFVCGRPGTVPWAARQFDRARSGGDRDRRPGGMLSV